MEQFLKQISPYEILNNFLTGVCFCILLEKFTRWTVISNQETLVNCCLFYFVGLVVGRIGSLIIEPFLKWLKLPVKRGKDSTGNQVKETKPFLLFAPYGDYVEAEKEDAKIDVLSGKNNVYRSLIAVFFCFFLVKLYEIAFHECVVSHGLRELVIIIGALILMVVFTLSYQKQTKYVRERVERVLARKKETKSNDK